MCIEFTQDSLSQLLTDDDVSPNSKTIAEKFTRLCSETEINLQHHPLLEEFRWEASPGSPYVGPANPESSEYLWMGLAHDIYEPVGKPSTGLQFEFGIDCGSNRGFFDRDVICGLYFGPWGNDETVKEVTKHLTNHALAVTDFLSTHPDYILQTKNQSWSQLEPEILTKYIDDFADGFTLTVNLSVSDICDVDIRKVVYPAFDMLLPLYLKLAGGEKLFAQYETNLRDFSGLSESPQIPTTDSQAHGSPPSTKAGITLDVESIANYSQLLDREDIESKLEKLDDRGASPEESLDKVRQYVIDMNTGEGLYAITGLGPISGYLLSEVGITTVEELAAIPLDELRDISGLSSGQAKLIHSNIEDRDPTGDSETNPTPSQTDTSETNSEEPPTETLDGKDVIANPLSEYYESLRSVRKVISTLMQMSGVDIEPDDLTDPRVQYYVVLDACLAYGDPKLRFTGYGPQHQDRLAFNIDDYRESFGDGIWVTDYQTIEVDPHSDETKQWLHDNSWLNNTNGLVRPVGPKSNYPLPELVETTDDLKFALKILSELPVYPPLPTEAGNVERTIPISKLYKHVLSDVPDGFLVDFE